MEPKKILARVLDEKFRRKLEATDTRTGVFSTMEFRIFSNIMDNADKLHNLKSTPVDYCKIKNIPNDA